MYFLPRQENVALDGLVMIARCDEHAIDTQLCDGLAKRFNLLNICVLKNRGIGRDMISQALAFLDHRQGFVEHSFASAYEIVGDASRPGER